jgi:hypothetical protein
MKTYMGNFYGKKLYIEGDNEEAERLGKKLTTILTSYPPTGFWARVRWIITK